jgi:hypothetical protein
MVNHRHGTGHHNWRGAEATLKAKHYRIVATRGKAASCVWGCASPRYEWANLTGDYDDVWDYAGMCVSCHRRYDNARRSMEPGFARHPWGSRGSLSPDQVRDIRARARAGMSLTALALEYGFSRGHMGKLARRETYAWVEE